MPSIPVIMAAVKSQRGAPAPIPTGISLQAIRRMSDRRLRVCCILVLAFWCHLSNTFAFQVLVDLNTYRKYDANSVSDVQYLKCDGVWAVPENDVGTFTQAEWGTILTLLGPWAVSEDNPGGHWDYDYMTQAMGRPPNDAMCYNETGGTPGGTTLTDQQIIAQAATHGGSVVVLTRAGGGEWITQLDRAFNSTQVVGGCLESPDPAVGNAPGFINDCVLHGKRAYVLLVGGMGTEWVRYQIQNMLNAVPALMASPNTFIVISDYSPSRSRSKWYGTTNCVQSDVAAALAMAGRPTLPPAAPAGLVAAGGDHKVNLSWNSSVTATSYNVKRSTAFGGPYTNVVNTFGTNYTDTSLVAGVPSFYVISAVNAGGQSADCAPASPWATAPGAWAVDAGGNWGNESNWTGYIIPSGAAITAIFSNNITGDRVVTNDAPRTVGNLVFGDADSSSPGGWTLAGASPLTLQVSSGVPVVNVSALGAGKSAVIACPLAGTQGLTKAGNGTLILSGSNSYSGGTTVNGASGTTGSLAVANGSFETPSISNWFYQNTSGANTYNFNAVSGFGWTFGTNAGVDHNSGTWYAAGAPAPNGSQAAFIQGASGGAKLSQTINFPVTGNYTVSFSCIGRAGSFGPNTIQVQVGGNIISPVSYSSQSQSAWQSYNATYNCTSAGNHTLAFAGVRTGGDFSSCIDNVQVTAPASTGQGILLVNGTLGGLGTVTVQTNAVLGGTGVIMGPVTVQVGGTLSPGTGLETLSVSNTLTLDAGSRTFAEVNAQTLTHALVQGITTATYGGSLVVSNLAGTLAAGQSFRLFGATSASGDFTSIAPSLAGNLAWNFNPTNGTLSVIGPPPPQFTQISMTGDGNFTLSGTGPNDQGYRILTATNLALPFSNWTAIVTGVFGGGVFQFTDLESTNRPTRFYNVVTP